jgi:hypothetical protein
MASEIESNRGVAPYGVARDFWIGPLLEDYRTVIPSANARQNMRDPRHITSAEMPPNDFIVPDADYFDVKARQCLQLARLTDGDRAAVALRWLALAFEEKARSLKE